MPRRFRICMAKGGRGSLRPSYGQPKLTLISRFVAMQIRCHEKLTLFYFWSDRFETNRTWGPILGLHVLFVSKWSYQKPNQKSVNFSWHLWFFVTLQIWVREDSVSSSPKKNSRRKFSGTERFNQKITFFANLRVPTVNKSVEGLCALNFGASNLAHS